MFRLPRVYFILALLFCTAVGRCNAKRARGGGSGSRGIGTGNAIQGRAAGTLRAIGGAGGGCSCCQREVLIGFLDFDETVCLLAFLLLSLPSLPSLAFLPAYLLSCGLCFLRVRPTLKPDASTAWLSVFVHGICLFLRHHGVTFGVFWIARPYVAINDVCGHEWKQGNTRRRMI